MYKNSWIIHAHICDNEGKTFCYLTGVYGNSKPDIRYNQWIAFTNFVPPANNPWVCFGDLNEIMSAVEKRGRVPFMPDDALPFIQMIDCCSLFDMGYQGSPFTWCNGQSGLNRIYKRLDRAMTNSEWRLKFANSRLYHQFTLESDNKLFIIKDRPLRTFSARSFRFEAVWLTEDRCRTVIENTWMNNLHGSPYVLHCKLMYCQKSLKHWNKYELKNTETRLQELQLQIEHIQTAIASTNQPNDALLHMEDKLKQEHHHLLEQHQILWAQKAGQMRLLSWDLNTKYYHTVVARRRQKFHCSN
ncbi:hypothetical protein IFM89_034579 [Coptis chinensis]|uniref:Endonuclease/exonuclease/phosphatase domain-containing protein n=1 Tax=Coptis chinensis TaxID=261450 RepID=A0A835HQX9_9MAGN|nr:hypothetical protein IFM89_034579 [Coptis chinensis]